MLLGLENDQRVHKAETARRLRAVDPRIQQRGAGALTEFLDLVDLLPSSFQVGENGLAGLTTVNSSTVVVAFVAGIAGILALETRAGAAVGVAISVTTIPASAYLGVAAGMGEVGKASGALAVLGINVAMLLVGGSLTLVTQEALTRRRAA